jgi:hypothetical protein
MDENLEAMKLVLNEDYLKSVVAEQNEIKNKADQLLK